MRQKVRNPNLSSFSIDILKKKVFLIQIQTLKECESVKVLIVNYLKYISLLSNGVYKYYFLHVTCL